MVTNRKLVAVYGSLRKTLGNHRLLESSEYLCKDYVRGFSMYSLGGFPFITPTDSSNTITIELYSVTDEVFRSLDCLEGYPSFYDRKQIETVHGMAWIYFIENNSPTEPVVESGDWLQYYRGL